MVLFFLVQKRLQSLVEYPTRVTIVLHASVDLVIDEVSLLLELDAHEFEQLVCLEAEVVD